MEAQCNDALDMASDWIRQDEDEELAAKVSIRDIYLCKEAFSLGDWRMMRYWKLLRY